MNPQVADLADRFWETSLSVMPTGANLYGDHRSDSEMEDVSLEAEDRNIAALRSLVDEAEAFPTDGLESRTA